VYSCAVQIRIRNLDYDTYPCVLHHNGGDHLSRHGLELKRRFFDLIGEPGMRLHFSKSGRLAGVQTYRRPRPQAKIRRLPELSIVTFCSYRFPGSAELSLNHFGVGVDVVRPAGTWRNIRKLGLLQSYLDGVDSQYVLYLDSHDTFVTRDILDIVGCFEKMGCPMVFQADAHDWPESDELRPFYDSIAEKHATFRYLCSGIFMGETAFVKRVVQRALETDPIKEHDDQGVYRKVFREFHPEARLDYRCELFQPLTDYRHSRRPLPIEPVELNLELRCRLDAASAPDPKALSARKLLRASTYKLLRILDRVSNPFDQHR